MRSRGDAAGKVLSNGEATYQYDAENRLVTINGGGGNNPEYLYDANGRRVRKKISSTLTEFMYDVAGSVMAERESTDGGANWVWTKGYVHLNGQMLVQYNGVIGTQGATTLFAHKDHLGSTRLLTKPDKSHDPADVYDYLPFGESSSTGSTSHKFTGKERDPESNLDYFIARYYSSGQGRFLSPDEFAGGPVDAFSSNDPLPPGPLPYAVIANPQSLNKYSYTWNNPLRYTDPDGHFIDTLIDIGSVVYSASAVVADVITGSDQLKTDLKALGGDLVGVAVPGLTGVGAAIRAANKVDNVVDAVRAADKVSDATKAANKADSAADAAKAANAPGSRPGQDFTPAGKRQIDARDGNQCQSCGRDVQSVQSKKGQPTPPDQRQRHHIKPKSEGGSGTPENGKTLCPECHKKEHRKLRQE